MVGFRRAYFAGDRGCLSVRLCKCSCSLSVTLYVLGVSWTLVFKWLGCCSRQHFSAPFNSNFHIVEYLVEFCAQMCFELMFILFLFKLHPLLTHIFCRYISLNGVIWLYQSEIRASAVSSPTWEVLCKMFAVSDGHILLATQSLKLSMHTCYKRWHFEGLVSIKWGCFYCWLCRCSQEQLMACGLEAEETE